MATSPKNEIADESHKTKKAREKLKKQLENIDQTITKDAIHEKSNEIHRWINRHASQRVVLRTKSISLFDGNQNAAKNSEKVESFAEQLKEQHLKSQ